MRYEEFKSLIHAHLRRNPSGATWSQLQQALDLPYERPCPEWTRSMQAEIGLVRHKGAGRALVWSLKAAP
jgi:hypothetical protein